MNKNLIIIAALLIGGCATGNQNPPVAAQLKDKLSDNVYFGEFVPPTDSESKAGQSGKINFKIATTNFKGEWLFSPTGLSPAKMKSLADGSVMTQPAADTYYSEANGHYYARMHGEDNDLDCKFDYNAAKAIGEGSCFRSDGIAYYLQIGNKKI